jgi:hypothetical protein
MQDFIDDYKITFDIDEDVKLDTSLEEGEIKISENGFAINASKDPVVLECLGKIKLYTTIKDERVFKPTTKFLEILMLGWIYGTMSKQLEVVEMDLLLEKLLIKKEDSPFESYAVLKVLGANPTLSGADSSLIDKFIQLDPTKELLDELEKVGDDFS